MYSVKGKNDMSDKKESKSEGKCYYPIGSSCSSGEGTVRLYTLLHR